MATCFKCKKDIGFFSRTYTCIYCGKTLCKNCITKLEAPNKILAIYRLLGLPHADIICADVPIISTRKDVACSTCALKFKAEVAKIFNAIRSTVKVELLPITYHGKRNTVGYGIEIESDWHQDWTDCDIDLIAQARYYGCDCVMKIEKDRDTETVEEPKDNGNGYYTRSYTIWKKSGIAYKLKK